MRKNTEVLKKCSKQGSKFPGSNCKTYSNQSNPSLASITSNNVRPPPTALVHPTGPQIVRFRSGHLPTRRPGTARRKQIGEPCRTANQRPRTGCHQRANQLGTVCQPHLPFDELFLRPIRRRFDGVFRTLPQHVPGGAIPRGRTRQVPAEAKRSCRAEHDQETGHVQLGQHRDNAERDGPLGELRFGVTVRAVPFGREAQRRRYDRIYRYGVSQRANRVDSRGQSVDRQVENPGEDPERGVPVEPGVGAQI
uniref:(northern house mosquito) hypothetical protein n=1 Tax=Culex pipiens TaxID=7175 RepID=A0A8D8B036_CULPI